MSAEETRWFGIGLRLGSEDDHWPFPKRRKSQSQPSNYTTVFVSGGGGLESCPPLSFLSLLSIAYRSSRGFALPLQLLRSS